MRLSVERRVESLVHLKVFDKRGRLQLWNLSLPYCGIDGSGKDFFISETSLYCEFDSCSFD